MEQTLVIQDVERLDSLIEAINSLRPAHHVFCFVGDLGAGKTTYIKALCQSLGVEEETNSPSFSVVNEYATPNQERILHLDLYRLKNPQELIDIGWYDYLNSDDTMFIEWPEMAESLMPEDSVYVYITPNENNSRTITLKASTT